MTVEQQLQHSLFAVEHDFWGPVPAGGHVLCEEASLATSVVLWLRYACQTEVADAQVTGGIDEEVAGLEVPMDDIGRVDVLETPQHLVHKVANVVPRQRLSPKHIPSKQLHYTQPFMHLHNTSHCNCSKDK